MAMNSKEEKHTMKRIFALLTALAMLLGCAAAETAPEEGPQIHQIEMKTVPVYNYPSGISGVGFPLYFADGADDLAYVDLTDWAELINKTFANSSSAQGYAGFHVTYEVDETGKVVTLTRESGNIMAVDFENSQIIWDDYVGFLQGTNTPYLDLSMLPQTNEQGEPILLSCTNSRERHGNATRLNLKDYYGINIIAQDGKYLVPLQTLSAFTFYSKYMGMYYNQEGLFVAPVKDMVNLEEQLPDILYANGLITPEMIAEAQKCTTSAERKAYFLDAISQTEQGKMILEAIQAQIQQSFYGQYSAASPKGKRSEALTAFGYGEFCLEMDFFYGLKDAHHISRFSDFLTQVGLAADLLDPEAQTADDAIYDITTYWLDDGHTQTISRSYLVDPGYDRGLNVGFSTTSRGNLFRMLLSLREEYPEAKEPYYEVGDTAFVTFDNFLIDPTFDYYGGAEKGELPDISKDTISLISYAHQQILREDSPIRNVVLDLSLNGGGLAPAAIWTLCWFLGEAQLSIYHTATGAEATSTYRADVNLDHLYDENDTLAGRDLNLYCLSSGRSFSCANLVPWAFKEDGRVTLLGRTTGGGSCSVNYVTTAWGTSLQISGPNRLSFVKNGAYYDVDQGVEPDVFIRDFRSFYDRNVLAELINGLR